MTLIRPFSLQDIWPVRKLQRGGVPLAIEPVLTHPHPPLWTALTAPWPWAGVGVATFVLDGAAEPRRLAGFVQVMKRATRPEADLLYVAPGASALSAPDPGAGEIWHQLLGHCSLAAASHGIQRIFASAPVGCPEEVCLKDAGFSRYTLETIYRLAPAPAANSPTPGFRQQLPQDSWALQRLYVGSTPKLVQQAEGALTGAVGSPMLSWWEPGTWRGVVWEPAGEVRGAVQVHLGRTGHWLRIWGVNQLAARELQELVAQGLRQISLGGAARRAVPIYAAVREYEIGLAGALTGFGFAPFMDRVRFVKHTVIVARDPLPVALGSREARQEVPVRMRVQ